MISNRLLLDILKSGVAINIIPLPEGRASVIFYRKKDGVVVHMEHSVLTEEMLQFTADQVADVFFRDLYIRYLRAEEKLNIHG